MRDLFDDFMRELQARQRQGQPAPADPGNDPEDSGDHQPPDDDGEAEADKPLATDGEPAAGERDANGDDGGRDAEPSPPSRIYPPRPTPLRRGGAGRGGRGGGRRPPRPPAGSGGGDGRSVWRRLRDAGPQVLLVVVVAILISAVLLVGVGLDLVTDAIWFKSVGYDPVFWTRLWAQVGLFALGLVGALVFLFANLWIAGRIAPRPGSGAGERFRAFVARLSEAARGADIGFGRDLSGRDPLGRRPRGPFGTGTGSGSDGRPPFERPAAPDLGFSLDDLPDLRPIAIAILAVVVILAALGTAGALSSQWQTVLLWQNRVPFAGSGATAVVDPIFGRDPSFYIFDLPFLRLAQSLISGLVVAALVIAGIRYVVAALAGGGFTTPVRVHLGILAALWLVTVAAGYQLDKLELVYSTRGVAAGVSYTDQAAQFFAFDALTIVAGLVAAFLVGAAFTRWVWPLGASVGVWFLLSILLGTVYPTLIQKFTVEPNQQAQESPYIQNNMNMTRVSYGLDKWKPPIAYSGAAPLTADSVSQDASTFQNARLWAYQPLQTALEQIQTVRQYYQFVDVDTDRYTVAGTTRQIMLSGRELAPELLPQAGSWVNQKIVFTHGFGLAMVPVNEVAAQGLPQLMIKDMPPVSSAGAPTVTQPRIYFGERANDWVLVGARQPEFDYPIGTSDQAATTSGSSQQTSTEWSGQTGIKLDSLFTRLLFAARFRDLNLLISDQVTSKTQLLMHRSLGDRLNLIAPFLAYDKDPYLVVTDAGRLVYVQDAYTVTDRFPNAQPFDDSQLVNGSGLSGASFDYIRNSVKIVMDAYDGTMTFYVNDPTDPLIRAWSGVFPTLFKSIDTMPADLKPHLRVPEELFNVQTAMYARYHVTDPAVFYQSNDLWKVPQQGVTSASSTGALPSEAYYVYMRMPGQDKAEFLLLQPMVPAKRPNMIAWIAARNDAPNYGQVVVYQFPDTSSIFGPDQVEARIEAEPTISSQLSLWRQGGSTVVLGNLIVVPVQDSILYLQAVYLQSTNSPIPALQKVVLASPTKVVWGDTLQQSLQLLLAGGTGPSPSPSPGGSPSPSASPGVSPTPVPSGGPEVTPNPTDVDALIRYANDHYAAAEAALRAGDFATYGAEIAKVKAALTQLQVLTASPSPAASPSPVASPSPATSLSPSPSP